MRRLRLGLVGAGRRAQAHVQSILALDDRFELVAVCDINPAAAQAIAARTGASAHGDVDEFFRAGRLEAVDIVTPPDAHHVIAKAAADYGVPMLIETPIAPTRQMAELIIEAAALANVPLEVGENVWRWPAERLARQVLQSGAIGRVLRAYCLYVTGGYHAMNLLRTYLDYAEPRTVGAHVRRYAVEPYDFNGAHHDDETWTAATIDFAGGETAIHECTSSWSSPVRQAVPRFFAAHGTKGTLVSQGGQLEVSVVTDGKLVRHRSETTWVAGGAGRTPQQLRLGPPFDLVYDNPFAPVVERHPDLWRGGEDEVARADELNSLYRAVAEGVAPEYGGRNGYRDEELVVAMNESGLADGAPVTFPLPAITKWEEETHAAFSRAYGVDPLRDVDRARRVLFSVYGARVPAPSHVPVSAIHR
jgi:predicted dehydrogenase